MISFKNHLVKTPAKISSFFVLFLISILTFSSCENFLQGEDIKEQIVNAIEYNNSQSYPIRVEAIKGTGEIKLPLGGEISKKVTDTFQIKFVPADDCKFIRWEVVIPDLAKGESASDYIEITDPESMETLVKLKKAKGSILIRPVCPQKLLVKDFNLGEGKVYKRDDTIKITFNNSIEETCKDNISVVIQGLDDEVSSNSGADSESTEATTTDSNVSKKYFKAPVITDNSLYVYVDRKSGDASNLIPVPEGGTRNISVFLPKDKTYYINNNYLEPIKVYLEEDFNKTYTINSETSDPTKMRFLLDSKTGGFFRVDDVTVSGSEVSYAVGKTLNLQYIPGDSCYFCGWKILRSYKDENGVIKTELVTADKLADSNINISFSYDDESNEWGYNARSAVAKAKLTINNYTEGELTIEPLCLKVNFNLADTEQIYPRDSNVIITFDKNIVIEQNNDEIQESQSFIKIPNLEEDQSVSNYFNDALTNETVLTIATKGGELEDLIPVKDTRKISVEIPSASIYYQITEGNQSVKAYLAQNIMYQYVINSETVNKTKVKFHLDDNTAANGILKVDDITRDEQTLEYSIGKTFVLKYKISNDYKFKGWSFKRVYTNSDGNQQEEIFDAVTLHNLNLSMKYEDGSNAYGYTAGSNNEGTAQATITVDNYIDGIIEIQPIVTVIPVGAVILEDNNGKISANNGILSTYNGISVKLANTKEDVENIISFSPDSSYEFLRWQIYDKKSGEIFENGQYIKIENTESENTSYVLVNAPENQTNIQLAIKPIVAERPQILDCTPSSSGTTLLRRDSTIQIIFDYDMDENSIYYTDSELAQLRILLSLPEDSDELKDGKGNTINVLLKSGTKTINNGYDKDYYYGYVKEGKTYYKNISIRNNSVSADSAQSIITQQFKEPVFENPRTLTLGIDRSKISKMPGFIQVLVNVGKIEGEIGDGFFYLKDEKVVSMNGYKRWIYRINNDLDETPPQILLDDTTDPSYNFGLMVSEDSETDIKVTEPSLEQSLNGLGKIDYTTTPSLYLNVKLKDLEAGGGTGSGLAPNFVVSCIKIADNNYVTNSYDGDSIGKINNFTIDYQRNETSTGAEYKGYLPLTELDEGIYKVLLIFKDQSGNEQYSPSPERDGNNGITKYNYYYFCYDKTAPFVDMFLPIIITDGNGNGKLSFTWESPTDDASAWDRSKFYDIKQTSIRYKPYGTDENNYSIPDANDGTKVTGNVYETELNLDGDTRYDFEITYEDYAGLTKTFTTNAYTRPDTPENVVLSTDYGTSVSISGDQPAGATYSNVRVRYREKSNSDDDLWTTTVNAGTADISSGSEGSGGLQIIGLDNGKTYEFEICSYNYSSGKYSIPYKLGNNSFPVFNTVPDTMSIYGAVFSSSINTGTVKFIPPASNYTKIRLYCSEKSTDFSSAKTKEFTPAEVRKDTNGHAECTFEGLKGGTKYYVKALAYYVTEDNKVETSVYSSNTSTKTDAVTNFKVKTDANGNKLISNNSIQLTWTAPTGNYANYYLYYRDSTVSSWSSVYVSSDTTEYTLSNLTAGHKYYIQIYAYSNSLYSSCVYLGSSSYAEQILPNVATGITTQNQSSTSVKVSWTKPTGTYTKLILYKSRDSQFRTNSSYETTTKEYAYSSTTTSETFTGLSTGETYYFKMVTYISDTLKTESTVLNCSTAIDPVSITNIRGYSPTCVQIFWTNPASYDGIRIYRGTTLAKQISASEMSSYHYSGSTYYFQDNVNLNPNTQYSYYIISYKSVNNVERTASTTTYTARTLPSYITMKDPTNVTATSVTLNWTNPDSNGYWNYTYLYKQKGSGELEQVTYWSSKTKTSYTLTGLDAGTSYKFVLKTTNNDGIENYNTAYSCKTIKTNLSTVSNVTCTPVSTTRVDLSWTKPSGYYEQVKIYYKKTTATDYTYYTSYTTETSCSVTGLSAYTSYDFKLETYASGSTEQSVVRTGYTKTGTPTISVTGYGTNSLTLKINASYNNGNVLYYKKHSESNWEQISLGTSTSISKVINGLIPGIKYDLYVTSCYCSAANTSTSSTIYTVTEPAIPANVIARAKEGKTVVSWDQTSGNENYFYIYYKKSSDTVWNNTNINGVGKTSYEFTNLESSTKYDFKVKSNYDYSSGNSNYVSDRDNLMSDFSTIFTYTTPPKPVTNLRIWQDDKMGRVTIKYTPNSANNSVDIFVNGSPTTWTSSKTSPMYYSFNIPNYKRGKVYTINVRSYHGSNSSLTNWYNGGENLASTWSGETFSESCTVDTVPGDWLGINGGNYSQTGLVNVITSNTTITRNESGGAFTGSKGYTVTLTPYSIGRYEVIQALFEDIMGGNPSPTKNRVYPVTNVSWYAAIAFCNKLSVIQGLEPCYQIGSYTNDYWKEITFANVPTSNNSTWNAATYDFTKNGYHLPTDAQWEFAARGGNTSITEWTYNYSGSNTASNVGWVPSGSTNSSLHEVGKKSSNRLGIYDMTGNAGELLTDWYFNRVDTSSYTNPYVQYNQSTSYGPSRNTNYTVLYIIDSYYGSSYSVRSRSTMSPSTGNVAYGFRLCRNVTYGE